MLIDGRMLVDAGEPEFMLREPDWLLLTHLHPDHAWFARKPGKTSVDRPLAVYAPEKGPKVEGVAYRVVDAPIGLGPYAVTPISTHHSLKVASQAYLIKRGGRKLLVTGDLIWINKEHHHLIEGSDLVITEASFLRKGGMVRRDDEDRPHLRPHRRSRPPQPLQGLTRTVCFIHFGSWFYKMGAEKARRTIRDLGGEEGVRALTGYDGMTIDLDELDGT
ncbi:MBL fold metallo-hydrolase [Desulfohalovibrio reitneri]|uniref:MBL fold metallo-hydrolase n=1 Tax=Desulfohalovibrio reitneri TaxID=1307759 RepID=UPI00192997BE|nr:MBL fold metallo-hydrolase [Desulfohalovibrio reitneri]